MVSRHGKGSFGLTTAQVAILAVLGILLLVLLVAGGAYTVYMAGGISAALPAPLATPIPVILAATPAGPTATTRAYPTLPPEWTATVTPDTSATVPPTDTPVATYTPQATYTRLPTYTPLATYTPFPTRTRVPAPRNTATQAPAEPTSSTWVSQGSLTGNGTSQTQGLNLAQGQVRIDWNYAGSPSGGTLSPADEAYHQQMLALLKSSYDSDIAYYESEKLDAAARRDALAIYKINQQEQARTNQYNSDVAAENARYQSEKAAAAAVDNTTFKFWVAPDGGGSPLYLDGGTGPSSGSAAFQATGGSAYSFSVQSSGPWTLNVYYRP